jgi:hypothetical protein
MFYFEHIQPVLIMCHTIDSIGNSLLMEERSTVLKAAGSIVISPSLLRPVSKSAHE